MSSPELIVMNGVPCAGKSTIAKAFVAAATDIKARHLPMGERLRGISSGQIPSMHSPALAGDSANLKKHTQVHDPNLPISVFEEFIDQEPADLVILDGFPRYPDRLDGFKKSIKKIGSELLAVCEVSVPEDVVRARSHAREQRHEDVKEDDAFIQKRLDEYQAGPAVVMAALASEYPRYKIDGTQPIDLNVAVLRTIYSTHTART